MILSVISYRLLGWKVNLLALAFTLFALVSLSSFTPPTYKMGKLKYSGGGDWYGNRTALPNLIDFCNKNIGTNFSADESIVEVGSAALYNYPFIYMTGHGNVIFNYKEAQNLRKILSSG